MEEYRGYAIKPCKDIVAFEVEYIGRGSRPISLRGFFTDRRTAKKFIDVYLDRKEVESGEDVQRSGDKQVQRRSYNRRKSPNNPR